ncbi:MAG TPA: hypothetical protein VI485_28105 [Vicinamibacterales bacterium]|nr:hypothetical protein [Vicinamibacterales bacterium]
MRISFPLPDEHIRFESSPVKNYGRPRRGRRGRLEDHHAGDDGAIGDVLHRLARVGQAVGLGDHRTGIEAAALHQFQTGRRG